MKALWLKYAARLDALSLRERVIVFCSVAIAVVAVAYVGLVEPQLDRSTRLSRDLAQKQSEMKALQAQLAKLDAQRGSDPAAELRERLARARQQLGSLNALIAAEERKFTAPHQMRAIIEELLARSRRVELVELKTLPVTSTVEARANAPANGAGERLVFRHGMEVTVSGTYLDLLAYLKALEGLPTQLYWGNLELATTAHPVVRMKVTVYTLSISRAWMTVS